MRRLVYLSAFVLLVAGVAAKTSVIRAKRQRDVVSVFSEWGTRGKPVETALVKEGTIDFRVTVGGRSDKKGRTVAYVSEEVLKKIRRAPRCRSGKSATTPCVRGMTDRPDVLTGLYRVDLDSPSTVSLTYGRKRGVLTVPSQAIDRDGGGRGCWVVEKGKVVHRIIKTGAEDDLVVEVLEGVRAGETVVTAGASILREGDRVNVLSKEEPDHD